MHPDWARELRDRCQAAGVAFLFKQWGAFAPTGPDDDHGERPSGYFGYNGQWSGPGARIWGSANPPAWLTRLGKHGAGRLLDGRTWDEYPS